jgi:RNA polymerase sigma-54 factor
MATGYTLGMHQQQRQIMTLIPQLRQSLEMLQMPIMALQQAILKEMATNPLIEDVRNPIETPMSISAPEQEPVEHATDNGLDFNPDVDLILRQADDNRDYFLQNLENAPALADEEEKHQHLYDSIKQTISLQDHLTQQLNLTALSPEEHEIALTLIGNIDDDGRFTGSIPDIAMISGTSENAVLRILKTLQTFDPAGIAARDLRECLLIQLDTIEDSPYEHDARILVDKYLSKLAAHDEKFLCKTLDLTPQQLQEVIRLIRSLNPRPGRAFENNSVEYVEPEVFVVKEHGRYVAKVESGFLPNIRISKHYRKMLEDPDIPQETKSYIRERIRAGAVLIKNIHNRQETIRKIAQAIVDAQTDFFNKGVSALKPMTMADVAKVVDLHETTVSRTVSSKYMKSPRGLFEMKYFFTAAIKKSEGDAVSNKTIQDLILRMVQAENPASPLSDQAIETALKNQGYSVARRTVAKYRGILKIPPTYERRRN